MIPRGLIGVVHVPALPGDPGYSASSPSSASSALGDFGPVYAFAHRDAQTLVAGGVDALIIENFGSTPFVKGCAGDRIPPHQAAALTLIASGCRSLGVPVGVNCLRNDAHTAIGIAAAAGLDFVRINVHSGAYVTDQGLIEGEAAATLRYRHQLGGQGVAILADVLVKHATPLAPIEPAAATRDCLHRGLADAVIVTGTGTGRPVDRELLAEVRAAAGDAPVLIGSGLDPDNATDLIAMADGAIVGSWFKRFGAIGEPVDGDRVRKLVDVCRSRFEGAGYSASP